MTIFETACNLDHKKVGGFLYQDNLDIKKFQCIMTQDAISWVWNIPSQGMRKVSPNSLEDKENNILKA